MYFETIYLNFSQLNFTFLGGNLASDDSFFFSFPSLENFRHSQLKDYGDHFDNAVVFILFFFIRITRSSYFNTKLVYEFRRQDDKNLQIRKTPFL